MGNQKSANEQQEREEEMTTTTDEMKKTTMNLFARTIKMKLLSKKEAIMMIMCIIVAFVFLVPLSVLAIASGPLALIYVKQRKRSVRPHEEASEKEEEKSVSSTKKEEIDNDDEKETLTNKTTSPKKVFEEKVALTGSAALMANMRRSAANTAKTGEKAKISSASAKSGTISKEETRNNTSSKSG